MRRLFVAGNWKMNTTLASARALASELASAVPSDRTAADVLVAPPFPYLLAVRDALSGSGIQLGAQNAWHTPPGAFTGEVGVEMLKDVGCRQVILGHSERRHVLEENDELINNKVKAVLAGGLDVILCVGELLSERDADQTEAVLNLQMDGGLEDIPAESLSRITIAYEPVWAIGTGKTATPDQAEAAHVYLRDWLAEHYSSEIAERTRILYGGSVNSKNAAELLNQTNVDGALVGGASLKADAFLPIIQAAWDLGDRG
jgi:triosephosphate isomerase (TIM)